LSESEKNLIGNILKSFAQTETYVNDYWATKVAVWFPKHEIKAMACAFADFESIHAEAYARLNEELGLDDFEAFMEDEEAKAKIDRLVELPGDTLRDKALSLAIFSAFTEGVNLFSSFAVLMSFQLRRTMIEEMPELNNPIMTQQIYEACDLSVRLEFDFIDKAFEMGEIEGLNKEQLKNFIKERANQKLIELGYQSMYNDIDPSLLKQMEWFGHLTSGVEHQDFFAGRVTTYAKSTSDWSDL
jgi:ribonucleoside-diphosphate reductase beta chain